MYAARNNEKPRRKIILETNMNVRGSVKLKVASVTKTITEKRLKWYGHVKRRGEEDAQRRMLDASTRRDGKEGRELGGTTRVKKIWKEFKGSRTY